jgi:adenylate kinase family enzyme
MLQPTVESPMEIGGRIAVCGHTGSGKTTFAQHLGQALGIAVVDLDAIRHANGWDSTPYDEFRETLAGLLDGYSAGWITAGNYRPIADVYLSRADTLVWLNLPWRVAFWRLLKRTVVRSWTGKPVYEGSPARESLKKSFLSKDSILWWSISHHRAHIRSARRALAELPSHIKVYELRSPREVEAFLRDVGFPAGAAAGSAAR